MAEINSLQEQHTAGPIAIGFDYQFYYFMYLALGLRPGEKIGFEVKDDVHIDFPDGSTVLFQAKHTISKKDSPGDFPNLTTLDNDLWKTLNNWVGFIKASSDSSKFLNKNSFVLATNKKLKTNDFEVALKKFKTDENFVEIIRVIKELKKKTTDSTLVEYFQNILSLAKKYQILFLKKLTIETDEIGIIDKIKQRILENVRLEKYVDVIFDSLSANLQSLKFIDISNRKKVEVSFEEFNKKFGRCFEIAFTEKPLPKREFPGPLPGNLEDQIFIRQLIEVGDIDADSDSRVIVKYTYQMLKTLNSITFWLEQNYILPTELIEFTNNCCEIWDNEFRSKYRSIKQRIRSGELISDLDNEIKEMGIKLIDSIRGKELAIPGYSPLGIELSNGHFYVLSNEPRIGWHLDWENKYKN
ncbi:MAG: hypothetical protein H6581_07975 [Bacteroidia bacterium]|nr:hypothetical protein [Bacteroidia bacterium]